MQRLFSTFPNAWPGLGLLVLRSVMAFSLVASHSAISDLLQPAALLRLASMLLGGFLVAGFWTPLTAITAALTQLCSDLLDRAVDAETLIVAGIGVSLAMLGPGAWSVDAVIFGRKKIDIAKRKQSD